MELQRFVVTYRGWFWHSMLFYICLNSNKTLTKLTICYMKKLYLALMLFLAGAQFALAQSSNTYSIEGTVVLRETGEPIPYAQIVIKELGQWAFTNDEGEFKINGVIEGKYTLQAFALGYVNYEVPITVSKKVMKFKIQMKEDNLKLSEVVVTAQTGESINSSNKIGKAAISHLQASSVADIMQLLPGGVTSNPSITQKNNISIRGFTDGANTVNNYRGTGFLINGSQISNDASMFNGGSGLVMNDIPTIDYRQYSTDNIESVEVIKGVASAEYGDITSGAVLVSTKAGRTPFEISFKVDPNTKAFSANKGFSLGKDNGYLNIDADYANAATDRRSPVNTFDRLNFGLTYSNTFNNDRKPFRFNARLTGNFMFNTHESDPDAGKEDFTNTRNNEISLAMYGKWMINKKWISALNYNVTGRYGINNIRDYSLVANNIMPTTNTMVPGIALGYFTSGQAYKDERVNDEPIYLNAKVSANLNKKAKGTLFNTILGVEYNAKGNNGKGVYYIGEQPEFYRERKYSDIPFMHTIAAFLEEKVTIPIASTSLEMDLGARFTKMSIKNYDYKATLDPRFNARYNIIKNNNRSGISRLSIHGGWGILQKLPSLNLLYGGDVYIDRTLFQYVNSTTDEQLALIQTIVEGELLDYNLAPAKTRNMEIGFDMNIGDVKLNVTYFNEKLTEALSSNMNYTPQPTKYYNTVTSMTAAPKYENGKIMIKNSEGVYEEAPYTMVNEYLGSDTPDSRGKQNKWGIEYDVDFGRINSLNTSIIVNGSYLKSQNSTEGYLYDYVGGQDPLNSKDRFPYISVFEGTAGISCGQNRDRLTTSVNLVTNIPKLRMVVSFTTQFIWMDRTWSVFKDKDVYELDANGNKVFGDYTETSTDAILYRDPVAYIDRNGEMRPFSDYYTTTDEDLKFRLGMMRTTSNYTYHFLKNSYNPYVMANIRVTKEIGDFAKISFYANNFTNSRPIMRNNARPNALGDRKNTNIYFGAELRITL